MKNESDTVKTHKTLEFTCDRCGKPFIPNDLSLENSHYNLIIKNVSPYDNCYCVCYDCYRKFRLFVQGYKLVDEDKIQSIMYNKETGKYDAVKYVERPRGIEYGMYK